MRLCIAGLVLTLVLATASCSRETRTQKATSSAPLQSAVTTQSSSSWGATASTYRGRNGERFRFECSGEPASGTVWGTDLYTDDTSVCNAAIHAGLITRSGGTVTIEIRPGEDGYVGSQRAGVASSDYGGWPGSFVFVGTDGKPIEPRRAAGRVASWSTTPAGLGNAIGQRFSYTCPPDGTFSTVWGTDIYTADSSVCTVAVHAGLFTSTGGTVTIEMRPGEASYAGTVRNGVTSRSYGQWGSSFVIVGR